MFKAFFFQRYYKNSVIKMSLEIFEIILTPYSCVVVHNLKFLLVHCMEKRIQNRHDFNRI